MKRASVRNCICFWSVLVFMVWSSPGFAKPPLQSGNIQLAQVMPISPSSPISDMPEIGGKPVMFKWTKLKSPDLKNYYLYVEDSKGDLKITQRVTPDEAECKPEDNSVICQYKLQISDASGTWWIRAEGTDGAGKPIFGPYGELLFLGAESQDNVAKCIKRDRDSLRGDLPSIFSFGRDAEWSVGQAVSAQMIKYNFATKKAGFNTGIGVGAAFRLFDHVSFDPSDKLKQKIGETTYAHLHDDSQTGKKLVPVSYIKQDCRAENFSLSSRLAAPIISVTPTIYITKSDSKEELAVEPAILFGFWRDILNFGVGFNLTGKDGEVGDVFLLFSIGAGFDF
ncbi:hypothetical protein PJI16_17115 [Nitrospira sp. MA-1]|nr:hypothetical protein [Nitrospira sp. MA-1]